MSGAAGTAPVAAADPAAPGGDGTGAPVAHGPGALAAHGPGALAAYGALGLPLAAAALPVYVYLPRMYGGELGVDLALLGAILFLARLADACLDPWLGVLVDRLGALRRWIGGGMLLMTIGVILVFHPPGSRELLPLWLALTLFPLYAGFSIAGIPYLAWGSLLGTDAHERTRVAAWREGFALAGVIAASTLPVVLADTLFGDEHGVGSVGKGLADFSLLFAMASLAATLLLVFRAPEPAGAARAAGAPASGRLAHALLQPLRHAPFRRLLGVFMLNGIAVAITATLVMFYVADVLRLSGGSGLFLAVYFAAAAAGLPLWLAASRRHGKRKAWLAAMLLALAGFAAIPFLGAGARNEFLAVCLVTGLALGADLCLPAAMLADLLRQTGREMQAGAHAGLWNFAGKLNLALAAGLALPLVQALGYTPGSTITAPLLWTYCFLPCALKLGAFALLLAWPAAPDTGRHTA